MNMIYGVGFFSVLGGIMVLRNWRPIAGMLILFVVVVSTTMYLRDVMERQPFLSMAAWFTGAFLCGGSILLAESNYLKPDRGRRHWFFACALLLLTISLTLKMFFVLGIWR